MGHLDVQAIHALIVADCGLDAKLAAQLLKLVMRLRREASRFSLAHQARQSRIKALISILSPSAGITWSRKRVSDISTPETDLAA
jgi:hypothetical protein